MGKERRESIRIPMRFEVSTELGWAGYDGDLSINGLRLSGYSPLRFSPVIHVRIPLPGTPGPLEIQARIKRYFVSDEGVQTAATFETLDFDSELAIAKAIDDQLAAEG